MRKIGLLGGTFDPPHHGHLIMAQEVLEQCELDEIWFLPSYIPPHLERKKNSDVTPAHHRIEMLRRAIDRDSRLHISLIEQERKGKSYTYDTLYSLMERYPDDIFSFIIGADMVNDLPKWYRYEDVMSMVDFIAAKRPGVSIQPQELGKFQFFNMPQIDISSTMIRNRIKENRLWHYFLPETVKIYIEENRLYG